MEKCTVRLSKQKVRMKGLEFYALITAEYLSVFRGRIHFAYKYLFKSGSTAIVLAA